MRTNPLRHGLALGGALTLLASAVPVQAQTIWACYVPNTGTIYRVMTEDTRTQCASPQHVLFSWEAQVVQGPGETPELPGEDPPLAGAEHEGNDVLHLNVTNTGEATTTLEGEIFDEPLLRLRNEGGATPSVGRLPQLGLRVEGSATFRTLVGNHRLLDIDGATSTINLGAQSNLIQPFTGESSSALLVRNASGHDLLRINTVPSTPSVRVGTVSRPALFRVTGASSLEGNATVQEDLSVGGASSFDGNATVQGDLSVGGVLSGDDVLSVQGPVSVDGDASINGDAGIEGVLSVAVPDPAPGPAEPTFVVHGTEAPHNVLRVVPGIRRVAIGSDFLVPEGNARLDVHGKTTVQTNVAPAFEVLPLSGLETAVFQVITSPARRVHVDGTLFVANAGSGTTAGWTSPPLGLTADSHISLTLTGDPGTRTILWVEKNVAQQRFRVHLSGGGPPVPFTYQVIEPF